MTTDDFKEANLLCDVARELRNLTTKAERPRYEGVFDSAIDMAGEKGNGYTLRIITEKEFKKVRKAEVK